MFFAIPHYTQFAAWSPVQPTFSWGECWLKVLVQIASGAANRWVESEFNFGISTFFLEPFLTFGIYDYVETMVRKTKKKLEISKPKLEIFQK
jgi:hypothetical protein